MLIRTILRKTASNLDFRGGVQDAPRGCIFEKMKNAIVIPYHNSGQERSEDPYGNRIWNAGRSRDLCQAAKNQKDGADMAAGPGRVFSLYLF